MNRVSGTPFSRSREMKGGVRVAWWIGRGFGRIRDAMGQNGNGHKAGANLAEGIGQYYAKCFKWEMDLIQKDHLLTQFEKRLDRCIRSLEKQKTELGKEADRLDQKETLLAELNGILDAQSAEQDQREDRLSKTKEEMLRQKENVDRLMAEFERRKESAVKENGGLNLAEVLRRLSEKAVRGVDITLENLSGRIRLS